MARLRGRSRVDVPWRLVQAFDLGQAGQVGHARLRADRDDDRIGLELSGTAIGLDLEASGCDEVRAAANDRCTGVLQRLDVPGVVRPIGVLAIDHVIAEVAGLRPGEIASRVMNCRGVQQRLRGHARPERARAAEQLAVDDRDAGSLGPGVVRGGFAGCAGPDDDDLIVVHGGHDARIGQAGPRRRCMMSRACQTSPAPER